MVEAINQALMQEMQRDKSVLVLGEDVGIDGGVFRASQGLFAKFGESRVIDTPLAESGIIGASIGLALNGWRPIAEVQFSGFLYPGLDQRLDPFGHLRDVGLRPEGHTGAHEDPPFTCNHIGPQLLDLWQLPRGTPDKIFNG